MRRRIGFGVAGLILAVGQAQAAVIYSNTFDTAATVAPGVSASLVGSNTATSPSGEKFSGNGNAGDGGGYRGELVTLTLSGLVPLSAVSTTFTLYVGGSADGNNGGSNGPDFFTYAINGTNQVDATFSNVTFAGFDQSYSTATPLGGGPFAPDTDAVASNHLGYTANCCGSDQDSDYNITGSGTADGTGKVVLTFQAGFVGGDDDSVGFDNVVVNGTVPEPAAAGLLIASSVGLMSRRRRSA